MYEVHGGDVWLIGNPNNIIDFSSNTNPLGPPSIIRDYLEEAIKEGYYRYYPETSYDKLRASIIEFVKETYREEISYNHVEVFNGASECLYKVFEQIKPRKTLLLRPSYSTYWHLAKLYSREIINIDYTFRDSNIIINYDLLFNFVGKLSRAKDRILAVICNPNNPTGTLIKIKAIEEMLEALENGYILVDESFIDFVEYDSMIRLLKNYNNLIIVKSLTKIFATPGLRMGFCIAEPKLVTKLALVSPPWRIGTITMYVYSKLLANIGYVRKYIANTRKYVNEERPLISHKLSKLNLKIYNSETHFMLISLNGLIKSYELKDKLLKKCKVLIRDASTIPGLNEDFIRISLRSHEENKILINCLKEVLP